MLKYAMLMQVNTNDASVKRAKCLWTPGQNPTAFLQRFRATQNSECGGGAMLGLSTSSPKLPESAKTLKSTCMYPSTCNSSWAI